MRTLDPILTDALANQKGETFIRVLTWQDIAAYNAAPTVAENTWDCVKFDIYSTSANATIVTDHDYTKQAFSVFIIERGVSISGTEYPVQSGIYFVRSYKEYAGLIELTGSSFPNLKISMPGNDTYENIITDFCAAIGKTATFSDPSAEWLGFTYMDVGSTISLNKADRFENQLKQKYLIGVYEREPKELVFYQNDHSMIYNTSVCWSAELSLFVAVASSGTNRVFTSSDGVAWTARTAAEQNQWRGVCWSAGLSLFVAVASSGTNRVMTSPDGITWTARAAAAAQFWNSITWSPTLSLLVAVGHSATNHVMTSSNGITWTLRTCATQLTDVAWSAALGMFSACGLAGGAYSTNGTTWTAHTATGNGITWSAELALFVVVGDLAIRTSTNGTAWTSRTPPSPNSYDWSAVAWSASLSLFVAVGRESASGLDLYSIATSPDGITWTRRASSFYWSDVAWSASLSLFVAVGETVKTSADGIAWHDIGAPDVFLTYLDGSDHHIMRGTNEVYFEDAGGSQRGDTTKPKWNIGYSTHFPITRADPYYKYYLKAAPVRLDITEDDVIHFTPNFTLDPTKTISARAKISEHFNPKQSPAWFQIVRTNVLFEASEGNASGATIGDILAEPADRLHIRTF